MWTPARILNPFGIAHVLLTLVDRTLILFIRSQTATATTGTACRLARARPLAFFAPNKEKREGETCL